MKLPRKYYGTCGVVRTKPKLSAEVLIHVATLIEFVRHSTTRATNDFLHSREALELG